MTHESVATLVVKHSTTVVLYNVHGMSLLRNCGTRLGSSRAHLRFPAREVGSGENTRPVLPGMVVQANVVTGSKSLMRYMLKPIVRSLDTAFGER